MAARPIPEGYHTISPSLAIDGAAEAIDFYTRAFGAKERYRTAATARSRTPSSRSATRS